MSKQIKSKANQSKRTFTLTVYYNGIRYAKYRTMPMSQEEFDSSEHNTENDWMQFLKTDEYEVI